MRGCPGGGEATEGVRCQMPKRSSSACLTANVGGGGSAAGLGNGQGQPREGESGRAQGVGRTMVRGCPGGGEATEGVWCQMPKRSSSACSTANEGVRGVLQGWQMDKGNRGKVNQVVHKGRDGR